MEKKLRLHYELPDIELASWAPVEEPIVLPLSCDSLGLNGTVSLSLDREAVDYDFFKDDNGVCHEVPLACSEITVVIDAQCGDNVSDEDFLTAIQRITGEYVNRLLSYIRLELGQYWVDLSLFSRGKLHYFLRQGVATWLTECGDVEVLDPYDYASLSPPFSDFRYRCSRLSEADWQRLPGLIIGGEADTDPVRTLIANAKQHFGEGSCRMAAVETVAAIELALGPFVREPSFVERCRKSGMSEKSRAHYADRVGLILQKLLPLCERELDGWLGTNAPKAGFSGESLLEACQRLNTIRNDVVHRGKMPDESDVEGIRGGIKASELLLAFIGQLPCHTRQPGIP